MERALRAGVFLACLAPLGWLVFAASTGALGPDPAEQVMHVTGEWSLRLLALTLVMSPLRAISGWSTAFKLRRMLGLYTFFYASLHFAGFLQLYIGWTGERLVEELLERPYIAVGFIAWFLMLPLAITSTRAMQRRLKRYWVSLHRLVYPTAMLACLHMLWQSRSDVGEALVYALLFAVLLGWRMRRFAARKQALAQRAG